MGGGSYIICKFATAKKTEIFQKCRQNFYLLAGCAYFYFYFYFSKLFAKNMPIRKKNGMQNNLKLLFFKT